ncbi:hypothetical protein H4I96_05348 [Botrytis cinerea]
MNPQSVPSSPYLAKFETKFIDMFKWDSESNQIFYSENTFSFAGTWMDFKRVAAFKLLGECKSLRTLKIGFEQDTMSGSKKPKLDLMTARGISTLRKIRGMEDVVVDVVEMPVPPRPDYIFPYRRSSDVPSSGPYFKPEMVQKIYKDVDRGDELERGDSRAGSDPGRTVGRGRGYAVRTKVQESQASPRFHNS